MKSFLFLFCISFFYVTSFSQEITSEEKQLYDLIMKYRQQKGLSKIPLSKSLTFVAKTHVKDLVDNKPNVGKCNLHSWSNKGNWSPCCYTPDHAKAKGMWSKPSELTSYPGYGFEIACGGEGFEMTAEYALKSWKASNGHNAVILNANNWKKMKWNAIGIAIYNGFAVVWFGVEEDPDK